VARIVPLAELIETHSRGRPTGGAVAITFDDAYVSLVQADEFLREARVPVTVFVTNEAARTGGRFWWDRIDDLFPLVSPGRWAQFENDVGLPESYRRNQPRELGPLRPLRQWILAEHRGRSTATLDAALHLLETETGKPSVHRSMSFEELEQFAKNPLVDFGVHTLTHPVIPLLPTDEFHGEVGGSWDGLRARLPRVLPCLAIPFGLFDDATARLARDSGMTSSLSLAARTWRDYPPTGALPRFALTNREAAWKLVLRVTGLAERLFPRRMAGGAGYPDLPSPAS
jgi:peptidoglycan/xylan/chitin deacetylase (PgdA/CDA1 family)